MSIMDRLLGALVYVVAILIIAGAVHIVSILAMPYLATRDAFARLGEVAEANRFTLLPQSRPGAEPAPFSDPATLMGVCRFNIADGPVRLRADLSNVDGLLTYSFHDRFGATFYGMTDRSSLRGRIDVLLLTQGQLESVEALDPEDELPQDLRLQPPEREGFVLIRSLIVERGDAEGARRRLATVTCAQEPANKR